MPNLPMLHKWPACTGPCCEAPTRRQVGSRRQKALGSPGRVAKIDKALATGSGLSDEQDAEANGCATKAERPAATSI